MTKKSFKVWSETHLSLNTFPSLSFHKHQNRHIRANLQTFLLLFSKWTCQLRRSLTILGRTHWYTKNFNNRFQNNLTLSQWIRKQLTVSSTILHTLHLLIKDQHLLINWSIVRIFFHVDSQTKKQVQELTEKSRSSSLLQAIMSTSITGTLMEWMHSKNWLTIFSSPSWKGLREQGFQLPWSPSTTHTSATLAFLVNKTIKRQKCFL